MSAPPLKKNIGGGAEYLILNRNILVLATAPMRPFFIRVRNLVFRILPRYSCSLCLTAGHASGAI